MSLFFNSPTLNGLPFPPKGVPVIVAAANIAAQTNAATVISFVTQPADSDFEIGAQMSVTASTALSTTFVCSYTDVANVARSMTIPVHANAGTFVAGGAITGAGVTVWETPAMNLRAKASTTITISTTAGTFTGVTYSASATIKQLT